VNCEQGSVDIQPWAAIGDLGRLVSVGLVQASIKVALSSPWVAEAVLLALGDRGVFWAASVGIDLVSSIKVARSSPTWGCRISEVTLSRVTL
jgi:hypothetical protein